MVFRSKDDIGCELLQLPQFNQRVDDFLAHFGLTFLDGRRAIRITREVPHQPLDFGLLIVIERDLVPGDCQRIACFDNCVFGDQFLDQRIEDARLELKFAFEFLAWDAAS